MRRAPNLLLAAALVTGPLAGPAACASGAGRARPAAEDAAPPPELASLAAQRVVVVPTQRLRDPGALGWAGEAASPRAYLAALDDAIAAALDSRGVSRGWVMPADVVRSARRNPTYATDPYALAVAPLAAGRRPPRRDTPLAEPLASQLRAVVALGDARYVLVPVELRFERLPAPPAGVTAPVPPSGRAVLHVALVDARASQVRWVGDVASEPAARPDPSLAASLAARLADLVAPR